MRRWGGAATTDQERRSAPETEAALAPPPKFVIPTTIAAASANVIASATKSMLVYLGESANKAPANPQPTAPSSIVLAATIALALPTCPAATRPSIAACRAG